MSTWFRLPSSLGALGGVVLAVSLVACAGAGAAPGTVEIGPPTEPPGEVQGERLMGEGPATLAEAAGKVTIVDFWATFCKPCKKSLPDYQKLVDAHGGELVVIGVSVDDPEDADAEAVMKFARERDVRFAIVWDKEDKTARAYDPPSMPTSYLLDRQGKVRSVHHGWQSGDLQKVDAQVAKLLE